MNKTSVRRNVKIRFGQAWVEESSLQAKCPFTPDGYKIFTSHQANSGDRLRTARAFVRLSCHTASGASFFAACSGWFQATANDFTCRVAFKEYDRNQHGILEDEASWILQGIKSLDQYDAGILEIDEGFVHLVDSKQWAWERAGAVLIRLVQSDVWSLSNSALTQVIQETAEYYPSSKQ